jgi:two-component system response regulator GlrR
MRVLLLDCSTVSDLCASVQNILATSERPRIEIFRQPINANEKYEIQHMAERLKPGLVFVVLSGEGLECAGELIRSVNERLPGIPIVAAVEGERAADIVKILRLGVTDFITSPFKAIDILPRVWRLLRFKDQKETLTHKFKIKMGLKQMIGKSQPFLSEIKKIPLIAECDSAVMITGETGTGKELFARAIHYLGPRSEKAFIPVNCGAMPVELMENELFGHVKGAYTGAESAQNGLIHEADGGTLFLDEIDCLSSLAQMKLLRFIQEKEYRQLGSAKTRHSDVRIISATNLDAERAVVEGGLRRDLFYRLSIIPLTLPPLRDRREDIPLLAGHFLEMSSSEVGKEGMEFSPEVLQKLAAYEWPGNVRELENIIERVVVLTNHPIIYAEDIILPHTERDTGQESFKEAKSRVIETFEKNYIRSLLVAHGGNISHAAKAADKNRRAFWELMRKHNIDAQRFDTHPKQL